MFEGPITIVIENKTVDKVTSSCVKRCADPGKQMDPTSIGIHLFFEKVQSKKKRFKLIGVFSKQIILLRDIMLRDSRVMDYIIGIKKTRFVNGLRSAYQ